MARPISFCTVIWALPRAESQNSRCGNSAAAVLCVWEEALSALKTDEKAAKTFLTEEERNQQPARKGWLSAY